MVELLPVFVGGTGRSGTTILKRVLAQHSGIVTHLVELRLIVDAGGALDLTSALTERWSPNNADEAIHRFQALVKDCGGPSGLPGRILERAEKSKFWPSRLSPRRYCGLNLAKVFGRKFYSQRFDALIDQLVHHVERGRFWGSAPYRFNNRIFESGPLQQQTVASLMSSCFSDLYRQLAVPSESPTHWLDDTPFNLLSVPELLKVFPNLRFIHMYRDPRDVMASYQTKVWGGDDYVHIARRLGGIYRRWFEIRDDLPADCFEEVSLEQLVEDPEAVLKRICEFLGLPFESSMLRLALDKAHTGRWRQDISDADLQRSLPHLELAMEAYGYAR